MLLSWHYKTFPLSVTYWTPELGLKSKILGFYEDGDESSAATHHQITNKLKENDPRLDVISAYTAGKARVNYGKNNCVYQKLKADNSGIIKANCMAHIVHNCATRAGDRLDIDIESIVNKTFSHFSASSKRILITNVDLKAVFVFVE